MIKILCIIPYDTVLCIQYNRIYIVFYRTLAFTALCKLFITNDIVKLIN